MRYSLQSTTCLLEGDPLMFWTGDKEILPNIITLPELVHYGYIISICQYDKSEGVGSVCLNLRFKKGLFLVFQRICLSVIINMRARNSLVCYWLVNNVYLYSIILIR